MNRIIIGDCREIMRKLIADGVKVQMCVTSPPYWGLRDYGTAKWEGGNADCDHSVGGQVQDNKAPGAITTGQRPGVDASQCRRCGARRVDSQLGLESTPEEYVANMVEVFGLVRELLADDGTLWLNLGDSYCSQGGLHDGRKDNQPNVGASAIWRNGSGRADGIVDNRGQRNRNGNHVVGLKPKDLVGIPWRVAFALQADGWYLRQDIIWSKPNPMPESVRDRCTKAHEYLFLLAKSERYYYDADAIRESSTDTGRINGRDGRDEDERARPPNSNPRTLARIDYTAPRIRKVKVPGGWDRGEGAHGTIHREGRTSAEYQEVEVAGGRNKRSVWTIPTAPYPEAHFATFPPALIEPCILAGSRPSDIVFDPFMGSGTTAMVALKLGRQWLGIELNPEYAKLADQRTKVTTGFNFEPSAS